MDVVFSIPDIAISIRSDGLCKGSQIWEALSRTTFGASMVNRFVVPAQAQNWSDTSFERFPPFQSLALLLTTLPWSGTLIQINMFYI